ncbi:hypothetical protein B296_00005726 [Ensete ventricosum]|uniref:Transposase (putative) gypsy type domain-containing protein n=1 Tax=Ensete ventricosum TaxID=4639 RepID=A0A426YD34_ENSVE|nr:hypothetical protein B296_00005726 [Ensete ventricosum]
MKVDHDLDMTVTEGSLAMIREWYSIPAEYRLHVPQSGQRPFSSDAPSMCISVDALEAGLRFPLHPLIEECLKWWRISPIQVAPNSWRYLVVFLGECRGAGIIPTRDLFMACFRICKNQGGYYLTAQVSFRVNGAPSNNKGWKSRYLFVSGPVWGFRLDWSAHPIGNAPLYLSEEEFVLVNGLKGIIFSSRAIKEMTKLWLVKAGLSPVSRGIIILSCFSFSSYFLTSRRPKKVKVLTRRHKSRHGEGESRSRSKGKELAAPSVELETPAESDKGGASLVHHRLRSMKDLFKTKVHKDDAGYYTLHMSDLGHQDPDKKMKARARVRETKQERDEVLQQLEAFEKELTEVRSNLAEIQRLLKEAQVRARKMDDELLQSVKAFESARVELPKQAVDRYKESAGFKEVLKRMGRVTYENGYRVALTRFHALYPDSEMEEDPFTIHPEDDLVLMKR